MHGDGADALDVGPFFWQRGLQRENLVAYLAEEVELDRQPAKVQGRFAVRLDLADNALDGTRDGEDVAYTIFGDRIVNAVAVRCSYASQVIFIRRK